MNLAEAKDLALALALKHFDLSEIGDTIEVIDSKTVEVPTGWVFFYNSSKFLRTKDFSSMLMGNKPIFVNRSTGEAHYLEVKGSTAEALADLAKKKP